MKLGDKVKTVDGIEGTIVAYSGQDDTAIIEFWVVSTEGRTRCTTGWQQCPRLTRIEP